LKQQAHSRIFTSAMTSQFKEKRGVMTHENELYALQVCLHMKQGGTQTEQSNQNPKIQRGNKNNGTRVPMI
jgi:hypothetical protein